MKKSLGIYIHIPFCKSKCAYCDFCSHAPQDGETRRYTAALRMEIEVLSHSARDYTVDTVFFGGGTPTYLSGRELASLLYTVQSCFDIAPDAEISSEVNPATADRKKLSAMRAAGFNRLSIGLQSIHRGELSALSRIHSPEDFEECFAAARKAGFDNINIDLMYGIPGQTYGSFRETLDYTATVICPEHISAYGLRIEEGTPFYAMRDSLVLPDEDTEYAMYEGAVSFLSQKGYSHYEISNYAKPGRECRHNLRYWNCDDYLGFGTAAHSCFCGMRFFNTSSAAEYITAADEGRLSDIRETEETVTKRDAECEYVMLRLRLRDGVPAAEYKKRFGTDFFAKYTKRLAPYTDGGFAVLDREGARLTAEGMYVSNTILADILDL